MINLPVKIGVAGRYRLQVFSAEGDLTKDSGWFDNLIVDNGLDQIANVPGGSFSIPYLFTSAYVGTGTTPPANTDTQLEAYLATSSANESATNSFVEAVGTTPAYWRSVKVLTFGTGVAAGTLSEVGVGKGSGSTNLFSRALIVDGSGNPTTITVLSTETLQVTYEYRSYLDKTDHTTTCDISGVTYDVTYRVCNIDITPGIDKGLGLGGDASNTLLAYSGPMGTVYNDPTGSNGTPVNVNIQTYTAGTYYANMVFTFSLSNSNFGGGIQSFRFTGNQYKFQMQFSPTIPKNSTNVLTMNLQVSWGRYTP